MPRQVRIRPCDYLIDNQGAGDTARFGLTTYPGWCVPDGGTQAGCGAAQLQHLVARTIRMRISDTGTELKPYCERHGLSYTRIWAVLAGTKSMSFEDLATLIARTDLPISLDSRFIEPTDLYEAGPRVVKTWAAPPATVATWAAARPFLTTRVAGLIQSYLPWCPDLEIVADPEPAHVDYPATGEVTTRKARLHLYLPDHWLTHVYEAGRSVFAGQFPVIDVALSLNDREPVSWRILELESEGVEHFTFTSRWLDGSEVEDWIRTRPQPVEPG